jgi:hypothetical protein
MSVWLDCGGWGGREAIEDGLVMDVEFGVGVEVARVVIAGVVVGSTGGGGAWAGK